MAIKIVTDTGSDIAPEVARELGITIVPLYVQFNNVSYRDGVDIGPDQVYARLVSDKTSPTTSAASPGDFADAYSRLCKDSDGIISVHLSRKLSATYDSALAGSKLVKDGCPIQVVDSELVSVATGLIAMASAQLALAGKSMQSIMDNISQSIQNTFAYGLLDSLKYIARSGRLGKAGPILGSMLPIKPVLRISDGAITPIGAVRARNKGVDRLLELVHQAQNVQNIAISHSTTQSEVDTFTARLQAMFPNIKPAISKLGSALGVHGGPGTLLVAVQQEPGTEARKHQISLPSMQQIRESIQQRMKDSTRSFSYQFQRIA